MISDKAKFAYTLCDIDSGVPLIANECERYGMTWGCDTDCPVFSRGECKTEDIDVFKDMIKDEDDYEDIIKMYPQLK